MIFIHIQVPRNFIHIHASVKNCQAHWWNAKCCMFWFKITLQGSGAWNPGKEGGGGELAALASATSLSCFLPTHRGSWSWPSWIQVVQLCEKRDPCMELQFWVQHILLNVDKAFSWPHKRIPQAVSYHFLQLFTMLLRRLQHVLELFFCFVRTCKESAEQYSRWATKNYTTSHRLAPNKF